MVQNDENRKYSREKWILGLMVVSLVAFVIIRVLILIKRTSAF
jgi:general stress protein CsbA